MGKPSDDIEPVISHPPTTTDSYGGGAGGAFSASGGADSGARASPQADGGLYADAADHRGNTSNLGLTVGIFALVVILLAILLYVFLT